jgi:fibronectin-binding autotransporter adhesin
MNPSGESDRQSADDSLHPKGIVDAVQNTGSLISVANLEGDPYFTISNEEAAMRGELKRKEAARMRRRLIKFGILGVVLLAGLLLVAARLLHQNSPADTSTKTDASLRYHNVSVPLAGLTDNATGLAVQNTQTLSINGQLNVNNSVVLAPAAKPSTAIAGQLYFDQTSRELAYYNGTAFVPLTQNTPAALGVSSLGSTTGAIALGGGLGIAGGTVLNTGVLTLQGQAGNITLTGGPGLVVSGTALSNSGLLSLAGQNGDITLGGGLGLSGHQLSNTGIVSAVGSGTITVTNDGNGNITIDGPNSGGGGTGTVASLGGTSGKIAKFTGVQTIADSLISDNGTLVTVGGDLSVSGTVSFTNALAVTSGGTGATSAAGARTNLGAAKSGANTDITSLSGLTTALSVAQGGTGIGTLATNGVIVGSGTSPLTSVVAGSAGQCLLSTAGAPAWASCPGGGAVMSLNGGSGALTLNNASLSGSAITIDNATTAAKGIASFNSTNFSVSSGAVNTIQNIATTAAPTFGQLTLTSSQASNPMLLVNNTNLAASGALLDLQLNGSSKFSVTPAGNVTANGTLNGQTISANASFTGSVAVGTSLAVNTITPSSSLTIGAGGQSFLLQGNASSSLTATNGTSTTTLAFQNPTANVTYNFPTAAAGTYNICTTAGNCVGAGGGVTTAGGTSGKLAKFTAGTTIGDSIISDNGSTVTIGGALSVNTLTPTSALTVGATGQNLTLQGATVSLSATSSGITNSLTFATPSSTNKTVTIPNASGTVAVSASGPLSLDASGNLTCASCLTSGGGGGSAGVSSVNSLTGALTLQGSSASSVSNSGTTITINDASSTVKGLASFNSTNLTVTSGSVNTVQDIAVTSTPTFAGLSLTAALSVTNGGTGATTAAGARTSLSAAKSGANSDITSLTGLTTALSVAQGGTGIATTPTNGQILIGNGSNYSLNTLSAGSGVTITNGAGTISISAPGAGTCSGCANTALSNLASVAINTSLLPGSAAGADLGSGTLPFGQLFLAGTSASPAANNFKITGASTSGTRTITLPDASGTVAVSASGNIALSAAGNITFTGTLGVASGGTGAVTLTSNGVLLGNGTGAITAVTGNSGECLLATAGAPAFGTCPGSGGVTSVDTLSGVITINNTSGSGSAITIDNATTAAKGIASFNSTNFSVSSGAVNTVQNINTTATPTFGTLSLTAASSLSLGTSSSASGAIVFKGSGGNGTITLQAPSAPNTGNFTLSLPTITANDTICTLTLANCSGSGVTTIGAIDTQTASGNGAVISGTSLYLQSASASNPGLVNTTAQTFAGAKTFNSSVTLGASAGSGTLLTNNGALVNTTLALGNFATGGSIGTAATTVDIYTSISVAQTTAGQTLTMSSPTASTGYGRLVYLSNVGTNSFTISGFPLRSGTTATFIWANTNGGASWQYTGADGASVLNQSTSDQTADFRISGTGRANTSLTTPLVDSITGALTIGTATATGVTVGGTTNTTALLFQGAAGATYTMGTSNNTGGITIGNSTVTSTISIGNGATTGTQTINIGTAATGVGKDTITIGSTNDGSTLNLQGGTGNVNISTNSSSAKIIAKTSTNATTAFQIQNSSSVAVFSTDTTIGQTTLIATADNPTLIIKRYASAAVSTPQINFTDSAGTTGLGGITINANADLFFGGGTSSYTGTTGDNTGFGVGNLTGITTGAYNTAIGVGALNGVTTAQGNVGVGVSALSASTGAQNTAIGTQALFGVTQGDGNVAVGQAAGYLVQSATANFYYNTFLGSGAGGQDNDNFQTSGNIHYSGAIGEGAQVQANNTITIGNLDLTPAQIVIGSTMPTGTNMFGVSGLIYKTGTASQSGTTITGSGTTWNAANGIKVGMRFIFADGTDGGTISAITNTTHLTVSTNQTVSSQHYRIHNTGFQVTNTGDTYVSSTSTTAFLLQDANANTLFTGDSTNSIIKISGTTSTFATLQIDNAHFKSTQTTAPTIGTPSSCATTPTAAVASGSTDAAGSFRITSGTGGGQTTCDTVITFNKAYGAAPKSIVVVPETKDGGTGTAAARQIYVSTSGTTSFTVKMNSAPAGASEADWFYYWVVE